jgi:hypothetical protein
MLNIKTLWAHAPQHPDNHALTTLARDMLSSTLGMQHAITYLGMLFALRIETILKKM